LVIIPRLVQPKVAQLLEQFPAVALLGPRQVGKTTLALSLAEALGESALYLDLELPSDRAKLSDPELYLNQHEDRLVILDEIHRVPGIFETLRSLIDRRRRKGNRSRHFLLLGSASIDLLQQSAETLAGRIAYEELPTVVLCWILGSIEHTAGRGLVHESGGPSVAEGDLDKLGAVGYLFVVLLSPCTIGHAASAHLSLHLRSGWIDLKAARQCRQGRRRGLAHCGWSRHAQRYAHTQY